MGRLAGGLRRHGKENSSPKLSSSDAPRLRVSLDDAFFLQHLEHLDDEERVAAGSFLKAIEEGRLNLFHPKYVMNQLSDLGTSKSLQCKFIDGFAGLLLFEELDDA